MGVKHIWLLVAEDLYSSKRYVHMTEKQAETELRRTRKKVPTAQLYLMTPWPVEEKDT